MPTPPIPLNLSFESGWDIPLSPEEFQLIGQLCAIQGQIEHLMMLVVATLLDVSMPTCRDIMASTIIANTTRI